MHFVETALEGAWLLELDRKVDERGFFARLRCSSEFKRRGLPENFVQTNLSFNSIAGTFRGLHYQIPPSREGKLVRCIGGAIADVIVDLRPDSRTYLHHEWFRLDADSFRALFVPTGFAHGFLTLSDDSLVLYEMSDFYAPELSRGICWNDPVLGIELPGALASINSRDAGYSPLDADSLAVFKVH